MGSTVIRCRLSSLRLIASLLVLEPLGTKLRGYRVFIGVLERINLVQIREDITLDDRCCEAFVRLLGLSDLLLEIAVAHVGVIGFQ